MKRQYLKTVLALFVMLFIITGCENKEENNVYTTSSKDNETNTIVENVAKKETTRKVDTIDYKTAAEKQMELPKSGETVAIMKVKGFGEIKIKFFEDVAPKAVENFITHAKNGYYDGVTFHRVINEFMIQGGDPEGNGTGGESIWGTGFEEELDYELVPYRGSLCMASSGTGTSSLGSQFFITQGNYDVTMENYLREGGYPEKLLEQYKVHGGYLSLYLNYTVFGQVYEGMNIVDKIAAVETQKEDDRLNGKIKDKPLTDVIIERVEITTY